MELQLRIKPVPTCVTYLVSLNYPIFNFSTQYATPITPNFQILIQIYNRYLQNLKIQSRSHSTDAPEVTLPFHYNQDKISILSDYKNIIDTYNLYPFHSKQHPFLNKYDFKSSNTITYQNSNIIKFLGGCKPPKKIQDNNDNYNNITLLKNLGNSCHLASAYQLLTVIFNDNFKFNNLNDIQTNIIKTFKEIRMTKNIKPLGDILKLNVEEIGNAADNVYEIIKQFKNIIDCNIQLNIKSKCNNCNFESEFTEYVIFYSIKLNSLLTNINSDKLLNNKLNKIHCKNCKEELATETQSILSNPKFLFIKLEKTMNNQCIILSNYLTLNNSLYCLKGMILFTGSNNLKGHYTTALQINNNWINISDDKVVKVSQIQSLSKQASLLLYVKSDEIQSIIPENFDINIDIINEINKVTKNNDEAISIATLRTDGGSRSNPGISGAGAFIQYNKTEFKLYHFIPKATNNEAEYFALLLGLRKLISMNIHNVKIILDSKLVVNQINGTIKCNNSNLYNLKKLVTKELQKIKFQLHHERRAGNIIADSLANQAMDYKQSNHSINMNDALEIINNHSTNATAITNIPNAILHPHKRTYEEVTCNICNQKFKSNWIKRHIKAVHNNLKINKTFINNNKDDNNNSNKDNENDDAIDPNIFASDTLLSPIENEIENLERSSSINLDDSINSIDLNKALDQIINNNISINNTTPISQNQTLTNATSSKTHNNINNNMKSPSLPPIQDDDNIINIKTNNKKKNNFPYEYKCHFCDLSFNTKLGRTTHEHQKHPNDYFHVQKSKTTTSNNNTPPPNINKKETEQIDKDAILFTERNTTQQEFFKGYYMPALYQTYSDKIQINYKFMNQINLPKNKNVSNKLIKKLSKNLIQIFDWVKLFPSKDSLGTNQITDEDFYFFNQIYNMTINIIQDTLNPNNENNNKTKRKYNLHNLSYKINNKYNNNNNKDLQIKINKLKTYKSMLIKMKNNPKEINNNLNKLWIDHKVYIEEQLHQDAELSTLLDKLVQQLDEIINTEKLKELGFSNKDMTTDEYYLKNKTKFVNKILNNQDRKLNLNIRQLTKGFKILYQSDEQWNKEVETPSWWSYIEKEYPSNVELDLNITINDYYNSLKMMKNISASGPDGIPYLIFKKCRILSIIMVKFYNVFILAGRIPTWWEKTKVILIDKGKKDQNNINNLRPISLQCCSSKIFTKILNFRLMKVAKKILEPEQKGFVHKIAGCEEHIFTLKSVIKDMNFGDDKNELTLLLLDLENAFGSLEHKIINKVLTIMKFPTKFIDIIKAFYKHPTMNLFVNQQYSKEIPIQKGVRQGDPISPLLFNFILDPLLKLTKIYSIGYKFKYNQQLQITASAYADDLILFTNNVKNMKIQLQQLETYIKWSHLNININKCGCFHKSKDRKTNYINPHLSINDNQVPFLTPEESFRYLGSYLMIKNTKFYNNTDLVNLIESTKTKISKLTIIKDLHPAYKIEILKTNILSGLEFILRNETINIEILEDLDHYIENNIKLWINSPELSAKIFKLKWTSGGMSVPSIKERYYINKLTLFFRNYYNNDIRIRNIIQYNLNLLQTKKHLIPYTQIEDNDSNDNKIPFLCYTMNNRLELLTSNKDKYNNPITIKNLRTTIFNDLLYIQQHFHIISIIDKEGNLKYIDPTNELMMNIIPDYSASHQIFKNLSKYFYKYNLKEWKQLKYQNAKNEFLEENKFNNQWIIRPKGITANQYNLLWKLRTNNMPCQYNMYIYKRSKTQYCAKCSNSENKYIQNNKHILQSCQKLVNLYLKRHNKITSRLSNLLKYNNNFNVYSDITLNQFANITKENSKLRPDILMVNKFSKLIIIIEVAVAFAEINLNTKKSTIDETYSMKQSKYGNLINELILQDWTVKYEVVVVDSTGIIPMKTYNIIKNLLHIYTNIKLRTIPSIIQNIQLDLLYSALEIFSKSIIVN